MSGTSGLEGPLERLKYFNGQRLDAADFRLEQEYHLRVRRRLNRALYSAGIAEGLEVTIKEGDPHRLVVSPGLALDDQGREIILVPPDGYWRAIAPVLKRHNILLIFDEVITGFGRTGTMLGMQQYGVTPDIASFAKGITSGYVPLGGVGVSDQIFATMSEPDRMFMHGFTYSGHPVACAVALPNIRIIEAERLPENAARGGAYLLGELEKLLERPYVGNVRGKGLMLFVEVVADKATKAKVDPAHDIGNRLTAATRKRGVIVRCTNDGIAMAPPLTIQQAELDTLARAIGDSLDEVLG